MQVKSSEISEVRKMLVDEDLAQEYEKQQLSQVYKEIKEELTRFKPESLAIFEEWVTRIYKFKVKVTDLGLETKNIQFSISSNEIQKIINQVLIEACSIHKQLIEEQLKLIREQADEYYKIDSDEPEVGYFDHLRDPVKVSEGTKSEVSCPSSCPNQQFYSYCVWIIYNHYCSLSECNDIVCELAKIFHQTSQNLVYRIFKQIDKKKLQSNSQTDPLTRAVDNCHQIRHIVSMVEDEEVIKVNELNVLTIVNLIPPTMSILPNLFSQQNSILNKQENVLYWHICSFETTINSIIYENKQNMRRYVVFLRNFKKAIKILKQRLGKSRNSYLQAEMAEESDKNKTKKQRSRKKFSFSSQSMLSTEIQKNIDLFRCLDDEFIVENQKTKSDEAQLVKNLEQSLARQKFHHRLQHKQASKQLKKQKQYDFQQTFKNICSLKKQSSFSINNQTLMQSVDNNFESITRISAMKSQKMNIERYKLEVILKKNEKSKKNSTNNSLLDDFNEKRKKIDIQLSENLQKQIVSQLKSSLNNIMKNPLTKQQQFANYLKITEKHSRKKIFGFDDHVEENQPNLHQFIQRGDFKNDQESEVDEAYLQKMEQQNGCQKKKKKKRNKKKNKKAQQFQKNEENLDQDSITNDSVVIENSCSKIKANLKNEISQKQYEVIKILENTKIDRQNRNRCFDILQDYLIAMQKRQVDILDRLPTRTQTSVNKQSVKAKKQKVK